MDISAYIILYYDFHFLEDILKNIDYQVEEIIIVDGPYTYTIETLKKFNLFYDENNIPQEVNILKNKFPKIKYYYKIFDCEEEKRKFGYEQCNCNNVIAVDTDEFIKFDDEKLLNFLNNENKFVGNFKIYNMCNYNINMHVNTLQKYVIFKKSKIDAEHHLDYTWLVGCKQKEKIIRYMDQESIGIMYHQTLNRKCINQIIKYIFYISLHYQTQNQPITFFDDDIEKLFINEKENFLRLFRYSRIELLNIPKDNGNHILNINHDTFIESLKIYENNDEDCYFNKIGCIKCHKNINVFLKSKPDETIFKLFLENVKKIEVTVISIFLSSVYIPYKNEKFHVDFDDFKSKLSFPLINSNNEHQLYCYIIKLNCIETIDNLNPIFYALQN